MSLTKDEYLELKRLEIAVDVGGNDSADIYEFEAYAQRLEENYQRKLSDLLEEYIVAHKDEP